MHAAAAERDALSPLALAAARAIHSASAGDERAVKQFGACARIDAGRGERAPAAARRSSTPSSMREAAGEHARRAHQRLELHRRLAFIVLHRRRRRAGRRRRRTAGRMLVVSSDMAARHQRRQRRRRGAIGESAARPRRRARSLASAAAAIRHGSRAARSPPGSASGARWPSRRQPRAIDQHQLAAPGAAVAADAIAVERDAEHRRRRADARRRSRRHGRRDAARGTAAGRALRRSGSRRKSAMQIAGDRLRLRRRAWRADARWSRR